MLNKDGVYLDYYINPYSAEQEKRSEEIRQHNERALEIKREERRMGRVLQEKKKQILSKEPTPKEFFEYMADIENYIDDTEERHIRMDNFIADTLKVLGYGKGIKIFKNSRKWYS